MSDPIKILTYLKENSADPNVREALALALKSLPEYLKKINNEKMVQ